MSVSSVSSKTSASSVLSKTSAQVVSLFGLITSSFLVAYGDDVVFTPSRAWRALVSSFLSSGGFDFMMMRIVHGFFSPPLFWEPLFTRVMTLSFMEATSLCQIRKRLGDVFWVQHLPPNPSSLEDENLQESETTIDSKLIFLQRAREMNLPVQDETWMELGAMQIKSICFFYEKGYTGPLSSSRSFEVRRSMALFIMKWMDLSLKECRMQGLSFFAPLRSLGIVLVDILEESNSATELLRFLGHMTRSFSWSKIQFRLLELLHQRSNSMSLLEKGDLSIFVSASLGFRELDSSRDFYVTFGCGGLIWIMVLSRCFYGLEMMLSPSSNEKFSSLVLRKPSASSVLNGARASSLGSGEVFIVKDVYGFGSLRLATSLVLGDHLTGPELGGRAIRTRRRSPALRSSKIGVIVMGWFVCRDIGHHMRWIHFHAYKP
ncbi:hypothetical protein DY000_02013604 [Brassica cretica]|uniref:Reverse transcriptase domain-containing protein n=1 Tax=Brassica cretica TaxID=69181 RepID=A0ABQ7CV26_BRACR|nr:hypothetical protein DY000_02013604 [Brassica cretica]